MTGADNGRSRILSLLSTAGSPDLGTRRLCDVSAEVTGMTGAGILLMSDDVPQGSICSTDEASTLMGELQFTLGVGPCVDAYHEQRPVLEPDLARPMVPRWIAFSGQCVEAGVRAVFGFPIKVGAVRLGALNLYRDQPGPMADAQHADSLMMSDIAAQAILILQANAPPGALATELASGFGSQYVVHQATGMVAAQLEVPVVHALIRLRAYAFANDRPLVEIARDVVDRTLRFHAESSESGADT